MRVVIQRVRKASVTVDNQITGSIGFGLVILIGVAREDSENDVQWIADKCINLRIFENEEGKFHHSLLDTGGEILAISQFTLLGDCRKGRRPSFTHAAEPKKAQQLYERFVDILKEKKIKIETGVFAARMSVEIHNDGPVTLILDSKKTDVQWMNHEI